MNKPAAPSPKAKPAAAPVATKKAGAAAPESAEAPEAPPPFFVLGCVRSGTTMLRDALRMHPNLACPEETHFFRWGEPYGTEAMSRSLSNNAVLKKHREIDGITEPEFAELLRQCGSRAELYTRYMALYLQRRKPGAKRWFDKTPQNVYGALLAASSMQRSKFVHIVRDPINVVASLRIGRIVKVENLTGACNYWNEAVQIVSGLKRAYPARVFELRYEDFVAQPETQLKLLLDFIGEPFDAKWFAQLNTRQIDHKDEGVLSEAEQAVVRRACAQGRRRYGYEGAEGASVKAEGKAKSISNKVPGARKAAKLV
ncbi:sulfotransferase [Ideonella sp.]|uniref:sulfotransferase family protein n=1 Tax=Ideonella sp. TaxID=1929293 RepID=UPI0035AE8EF2